MHDCCHLLTKGNASFPCSVLLLPPRHQGGLHLWTVVFACAVLYLFLAKLAPSHGGDVGRPTRERAGASECAAAVPAVRPALASFRDRARRNLNLSHAPPPSFKLMVAANGILFDEAVDTSSSSTSSSASHWKLCAGAEDAIHVLASLAKVYVVCKVPNDATASALKPRLEKLLASAGEKLTGAPRILFCAQSKSKVSMARQVEPDVYIDADVDVDVTRELQRFKIQTKTIPKGTNLYDYLNNNNDNT